MSTRNKNAKLAGALLTGALAFTAQAKASSLFSTEDWGAAAKLRTQLLGEGDLLTSTIGTNLELTCGEGKCGEGKCGEAKCAGHKGKKHDKSSKKADTQDKAKEQDKTKKQQAKPSAAKKETAAEKK